MLTKTYDVEVKAEGDAGQFTALASVFGNVDLVGDRVMPGAFKRTLARWRKSGDPIPVIHSHDWDDPFSVIGSIDAGDAKETKDGLVVKGQLDLDNPKASQVYRLMKARLLKSFSFGYTVNEESIAEDGANEIHDLDLVEIGPTLKGANPEAQLQAVKSHDEVLTRNEARVRLGMAPMLEGKLTTRLADLLKGEETKAALTQASPAEAGEKDSERVEDTDAEEPQGQRKVQDPLRRQVNWALYEIALGEPPRRDNE